MQDRYSARYKGKSIQDGIDTYDWVISSSHIDRVGDSVNVKGMDLSEFKRNSMVFRNHKGAGIGISTSIGVIDDELIAKCQFHEITLESWETKAMIDGGYLKTASIGFEPIKMTQRELTDEDKKAVKGRPWIKQINIIQKSILIEFSIVDLPANIEAELRRGVKKGMDLSVLTNEYNGMIKKDSEYNRKKIMAEQKTKKPIEALEKDITEKAGAVLSKANIAKLDTIIEKATSIRESAGADEGEKEATLNDILKAIEGLKPTSVLDNIEKELKELNDKTEPIPDMDFLQWEKELKESNKKH